MLVSISGVAQTGKTRQEIACYDDFTSANQSNSTYCGFLGKVPEIPSLKVSCYAADRSVWWTWLVDEYLH